jgi:tetratricopeptide (TPR) repeat protein
MVTRIGRGGMGEVWRADDLTLNTPIALKFVNSATSAERERILREVRLARQITHPAVCRVFDVGEADGKIFYTMELIEGEDLATLLRHAGRLPAERVLEIAQQLSAGLAAAHAQGVLHRDLKPANILIDDAGIVRITDFGIATARNDVSQTAVVGTPAYMAPEQLTGFLVSEKTDIYALGLILYELIVGRRPFLDSTRPAGPPPRPSTVVPDVDARLERTVMHALRADPRLRAHSAAAMAAMLDAPSLPERQRSGRLRLWLAGAALAAMVVVLAVVASRFLPRASALTDRDTIILADFTNNTNEPVFDGTLKVALAVALEQSAFLKVFPDDNVHDTLRLMQRSPDERLTRQLARDVARREQLKAFVAGSIDKLGSHYALALEAVNAESGDVVAREQVEAEGAEQVLTALGGATSRLREKLGESLASVQRFDAPLARATTLSLEALHAYSLALDEGRIVVPRLEAIPHLNRALELDPDFAMAHALLSGIYRNTGRSTEAAPHSQRAFELRDRVSERERYFISWRYYLDMAQNWGEALDLSMSWTTTYPREAFAFNSLGLAQSAFGRHDRAVEAFREAMRLDPRFISPYGNVAGSLTAMNRYDEANAALDAAARRGIDFISLRRQRYVLGFVKADTGVMGRELKAAEATPEGVWSTNWTARDALFSGQFQMAHDRFAQSAQAAVRENFPEFAAQWTMEDAEAHAVAEQCGVAASEVSAGLALRRDNFTLERAGRTLALCGADTRVSEVLDELARRFREATLTARLHRPVILAALALHRGDATNAVSELDAVAQYDHAPAAEFWPSYLRGLAYLRLKDGRSAASAFRNIVDHRGEAPTSPLYALAHLGLARSAVLINDSGESRRNYDTFFSIWKDADPNVPAVRQARAEYARLQ